MPMTRIFNQPSQGPAPAEAAACTHARNGCWTLATDAALSLRPTVATELRVVEGTLWFTLDGLQAGAREASGDEVLHAGDSATVPAGRHLVLQALGAAQPVYFDWQPAVSCAALAVPVVAARRQRDWRVQVAQPLAELHAALASAVRAAGKLATGLAGYAIEKIAGRAEPAGAGGQFDAKTRCPGTC